MPNTSELNEKEGQLNEALQKLSDLEEAYEHERLRNTADRVRKPYSRCCVAVKMTKVGNAMV